MSDATLKKLIAAVAVAMALFVVVELFFTDSDGDRGYDSPDDLFRAAVDYVGDPSGADALFPSDSLVESSLDCPGEKNRLLGEIQSARKQFVENQTEIREDFSLVFLGSTKQSADVYRHGQSKWGCKLKVYIEVQSRSVELQITENGETQTGKSTVKLIRIADSGWFMLRN